MATTFHQLNAGWNAEPNAPDPRIDTHDRLLRLSFTLNHMLFDFQEGDVAQIAFTDCWRYRLGPTNDEGWYREQCRFGKRAPQWGEFYEVAGDLFESGASDWRVLGSRPDQSRHFLFYLRDCTFECDAKDWTLILPAIARRDGGDHLGAQERRCRRPGNTNASTRSGAKARRRKRTVVRRMSSRDSGRVRPCRKLAR